MTAVHISKQSLFRLKITVGCPPCTCPSIRVCVVCVVLAMCACSVVCGVCCCCCVCVCVCVGVDVRFVFWCCGVLCCVVTCGVGTGVGVHCVVCGVVCGVVCVVCVVLSVCGAAWHSEKPLVCRFKTSPCVGSKTLPLCTVKTRAMTMITRPIGSLCKQSFDLPQCQSACALAHSLSGEHVRIMHETTVPAYRCKPRATWNEVGMYLCWKWVMCLCLVAFGYVWSC